VRHTNIQRDDQIPGPTKRQLGSRYELACVLIMITIIVVVVIIIVIIIVVVVLLAHSVNLTS